MSPGRSSNLFILQFSEVLTSPVGNYFNSSLFFFIIFWALYCCFNAVLEFFHLYARLESFLLFLGRNMRKFIEVSSTIERVCLLQNYM